MDWNLKRAKDEEEEEEEEEQENKISHFIVCGLMAVAQ